MSPTAPARELLVGPYSVRPLPGVDAALVKRGDGEARPAEVHDNTVPARLKRKRTDPLLGVLSDRPDLPRALARLAERA